MQLSLLFLLELGMNRIKSCLNNEVAMWVLKYAILSIRYIILPNLYGNVNWLPWLIF